MTNNRAVARINWTKSNEQRAKSNEQRAKSSGQLAKINEQRAKSNEQRATNQKFNLKGNNILLLHL